ncbi:MULTISPECIES: exodeoxyribonuclease V subunit beta [unclassified Leeuwenhoekiella]|uniref:UvrD-helicase domain-containing protein n=1 Tax=unclassified Leeuwenhoekiella TaxID=2615029 RepID=UPI000C471661|nr:MULTISPECIES: UvrD-helicase domain-containing protein [unclassified Leeuwenhoekiella]MAW95910.1 DNA helicase UvrD [Leeuwenhoekiella sp.]MBA79905.1 DNA helicase UvrD [Leeuwenhoekiella sp.]|tara:strand:+ start:6251 stop:9391 length:3141 start_codon:yes stop_codon:yes gene_type:complete
MENEAAFLIYNASAGAGKTFTLVKNYLVILFKSSNEFKYRRILAITFTNKAVAEMKTRIVESLQEFTQDSIFENPGPLLLAVEEKTGLERKFIQQKAQRLLKNIIQDFASFDVVTIDTFTHRIIRTFAYDLKIPQNFEVELNTQEVLEQAVDRLIDKTGSDKQITNILIDYALEKTDEDKSWDIARDFYEISKLLLRENDLNYLKLLESKSLEDFTALKKSISKRLKNLKEKISSSAQAMLDFFDSEGLEDAHFTRKSLPNALRKLASGDLTINLNTKWVENLGAEPLYTKNQKEPIKAILDGISGEIASQFSTIKSYILKYGLNAEIYKKITQLSVLQAINKEVQKIKEENNLVLISDFNQLINSQIINQPTPFIYERLGERYENYFIDEFQDTSRLQWQNLVPLIDNALSTYTQEENLNSLMLVGDPKQAIYRWRGGDADQFIALAGRVNPFQNENKKVFNLPRNYRSYSEIISFNNAFFTKIAKLFENPDYEAIYKTGNAQELNSRTGGFVSLNFVEVGTKAETTPQYLDEVITTIANCLKNGFQLRDLCILVRRNSEGVEIAQKLQEENIPVISSESLLLSQSPEVDFLTNILHFIVEPGSNAIAIKVLEYIAANFYELEDTHGFYSKYISLKGQELFEAALPVDLHFDIQFCSALPLYESAEYIVRSFGLQKEGGSYIQFFLDAIFDFSQKHTGGLPEFLNWWELKKDRLSISTPPEAEAVQIMTIHKAKGLEFPVVIYPFADTQLYPNNADNYNWYLPEEGEFGDFDALLINQNSKLKEFNEQTASLYDTRRSEQQLDSLNILYVALTRSIEQLHIISCTAKNSHTINTFADLLFNYATGHSQFDKERCCLALGSEKRISKIKNKQTNSQNLRLISSAKEDHNIAMVIQELRNTESDRAAAVDFGNVMHNLLAEITEFKDVDHVLRKAQSKGIITSETQSNLKAQIEELINEVQSEGYFNTKHKTLNERDIQLDHQIIRPDRIEINSDNEVLILDYKTGLSQDTHHQQIAFYAKSLEKLGFKVVKKGLYYLNNDAKLILL